MDLETARSDFQKAQGNARLARGRIEYLELDAGRAEVVEAYRHTPEGKLEVAMAVKAGFDFLASRLPDEVRPNDDTSYPFNVYNSLHILRSLEVQGVIIPLEPMVDEDEEEESGEEGADAVAQPLEEATTGDAPPPVGDDEAISQPSDAGSAGVVPPPPALQ